MISLFETIIEILSVPLEKWDKLGFKYKIIFSIIVLICIAGIVIVLNYQFAFFIYYAIERIIKYEVLVEK